MELFLERGAVLSFHPKSADSRYLGFSGTKEPSPVPERNREMSGDVNYYENPNYRLIEYLQDKDRDLYLIMCGIEQCLPGKEAGPDTRRGYHLHAVIAGKGRLRIAGKEYAIHAGQMFLTVPGEVMWYQADREQPWYYCWTTYGGSRAGEYLASAGFTEGVYVQDCKIDVHRFLAVSQEMLSKPQLNYSSELFRAGLAFQFLSLAVESYEGENRQAGYYSQLSVDDCIDYAIKYIHNNYANVRIQEVARYVNLNRTYFTELFRKRMMQSPQEYLMKVRMERGCELLRTTELPIQMIAASIGYENPLTFSKMFKMRYGISPSLYRTQNRTGK